jgi:hypothetical protein
MRKVKMTSIFKPHLTLHARIRLLASFILLAGETSSILIYQNAHDIPSGYNVAISSNFLLNLELHGGMITVLLTDITDWFCGLWQGKDLAFTIAYLSVIVSAGLFFIAKLYALDPTAVDDHGGMIE